jgi:NADH-quinone oxidoreductase subunit M
LVAAVSTSSLLGFPGLGGFISQGLLLIGSYRVSPWVVLLSAFAIVIGAHTLFSLFRWIFLGQESPTAKKVFDLTLRERGYLFPVVLMLVATGVYPKPWLELVRPAVLTLLSLVK